MGLFDNFKLRKPQLKNENTALTIYAQKMCAVAMEYAQEFDKKLDFSENSIADLEEILDWYAKDLVESKPTENQIWSMAMIFGSYLGETILKNGLSQKGYAWQKDDSCDIPLLICEGGWHITPIDKVYKRLVNGSEDTVVSFYKYAVSKL